MLVIADTHVHLYPSYDLGLAVDAAFENLHRLTKLVCPEGAADGAVKVICLTERSDCHFFKGLRDGSVSLPGNKYVVHNHGDQVLMVSSERGDDLLLVVAGRQIVTRERLEILALTVDADIPDGLPAADVLQRIRSVGGLPVITWAAGKWLFRRGALVRRLITAASKGDMLIGDSSLRPAGWKEPGLIGLARNRGIRVVAGSDPLPFSGEETRIGTYGIGGRIDFNWRDPVGSIRAMLLSSPELVVMGERGDLKTVWGRLTALRRAKKTAGGKAMPSTRASAVTA